MFVLLNTGIHRTIFALPPLVSRVYVYNSLFSKNIFVKGFCQGIFTVYFFIMVTFVKHKQGINIFSSQSLRLYKSLHLQKLTYVRCI